jgi:hypothetical protein
MSMKLMIPAVAILLATCGLASAQTAFVTFLDHSAYVDSTAQHQAPRAKATRAKARQAPTGAFAQEVDGPALGSGSDIKGGAPSGPGFGGFPTDYLTNRFGDRQLQGR